MGTRTGAALGGGIGVVLSVAAVPVGAAVRATPDVITGVCADAGVRLALLALPVLALTAAALRRGMQLVDVVLYEALGPVCEGERSWSPRT